MSWYRDEYLKSEDWKNLRLAILIYQDYLCECCGGKATDVHHLVYRNIWDVIPSDLMACCRKCHDSIHAWLKKNPDAVKYSNIEKKKLLRKTDKAGILIRILIAEFVSPRKYVQTNFSFGSVGIIKRNIRIFSREQTRLNKARARKHRAAKRKEDRERKKSLTNAKTMT